ncbi:hypothetical protein RIF29_15017 [Crotalaria pallida]|uniref:Glycine-rich protein n=1 Tax=Crotalaria pallida TaxID=3830 RepID=A0AAN9FEG3_CROPI
MSHFLFTDLHLPTSLPLVRSEYSKMGSKTMLVLFVFLATIFLISANVAPKQDDEKFDQNDGDVATNGVDESKYVDFGGPYGHGGGYGPWRGGCRYGCCDRWGYGRGGGYGGPWRGGGYCGRCCRYPGEHLDIGVDATPHN